MLVHGDADLEKQYLALTAACTKVRQAIDGFQSTAMAAIKNGANLEQLNDAIGAGQQVLRDYPAESNLTADQAFIDHLKVVVDALGLPLESQSAAFNQLMEAKIEPELRAALKTRLDTLAASENEAQALLETARRHMRDDNYPAAQKVYQALIQRTEWADTTEHRVAVEELAAAKKQDDILQTGKSELKSELIGGQFDKATETARMLGLKYLPLLIDSSPSGAELWQAGRKIGETPYIADINAADRTEYTVPGRRRRLHPARSDRRQPRGRLAHACGARACARGLCGPRTDRDLAPDPGQRPGLGGEPHLRLRRQAMARVQTIPTRTPPGRCR